MAWKGLETFLAELEGQGDLHRIPVEVSPELELAEITDRISALPGGGPALLFEKITGSRYPAAANTFGSASRMAAALGIDCLDDLSLIMEKILVRTSLPPALSLATDNPACHEVVERIADLTGLPLVRGWPGDGTAAGGRYLTLPLVITADPVTGELNCGIYRVEVLGPDRAVIGWHPGSDGERHFRQHTAAGKRMPVAIALGGPPQLILAASFSLPGLPDEFSFAGLLSGAPVEVTRCLTSDCIVPAAAEVVIEGYLESGETATEGPFGNHTGYYAPPRQAPLFRVTAITRRQNPLIPLTIVGPPPQEDCWLAKAGERLMLPWMRQQFPGVVSLFFPMETIFHRCAMVSVDRSRSGDVTSLLRRLRESGPLRCSKVIIVTDADTRLDPATVWWRTINSCNWQKDLSISADGMSLDIDATRKPERGEPLERREAAELVDRRWQEYGWEPPGTAKTQRA